MTGKTAESRAACFSQGAAVPAFTLLCAFYSIWPLWRAFYPMEIDANESWNAYQADAALGAGPLYPDPAALISNNYPPLSYYLIGLISRAGFDATYVGRALSIVAIGVIAICIGACIRRFNGSWPAATLGAVWFVGTMVRFADWYVGMNDPHLLALAIMGVALVWYLYRDSSRAAEPVVLLMVIAGFFKHTLIAIPATVIWHLAARNRYLAARAALFAVGLAAFGIIICTFIFGYDFIEQVFFSPRELSVLQAMASVERLGGLIPGLVLCGIWALHDRSNEGARFTTTFVTFAFISYLLQKLGVGVDINAQFELTMAVAIGVGLVFDRAMVVPIADSFGNERKRLGVVGLLSLWLIAAPGLEPYLLLFSPSYRAVFQQNADVMAAEVRRIAAIPGPVACLIRTVCRQAGKGFVYDASAIGHRIETGRTTEKEANEKLAEQGVRYEQIDMRASAHLLSRQLIHGRVGGP
jgi:hypothetical protein